MPHNHHMIQQQNFEIQFEQFSDGIGIQNEIKDLFYEKLLPRAEQLFNEIAGEKYRVSIEKLEIDCGLLSGKYWQEELVEETLRQLRRELVISEKKEIKNLPITQGTGAADTFDSFLFFLEKGYLAWNSHINSIKELEISISENVKRNSNYLEKIKSLYKKKPFVVDRLLYNFSDTFFLNLMEQLAGNKQEQLQKIYLLLDESKLTNSEKHVAHCLLFKTFSENPANAELFYSSITASIITAEKEKQLKKVNNREDIDFVYVENAGLVLLHPFLRELFQKLELWVDKQWKDNYSQHLAVHVLEYLISGHENSPEFNLPLNKILCGMNILEVLQPVRELPSGVKEECELLLQELIHHWSILKNTSITGLRETFLQRNGKISPVDKGWLLNVEQKGVDVLLNSLPWGIGVIKLPWNATTIFVEWI